MNTMSKDNGGRFLWRKAAAAAGLSVLLAAALRAGGTSKPAAGEDPKPAAGEASEPQPDEAVRARAVIEAAIKKDPSNSELWVHLGLAEKHLGRIDEAQRAFEKAAAINPKNIGANFMLGLIYEKKKMKERAVAAWTVCLSSPDERLRNIAQNHLHRLSAE